MVRKPPSNQGRRRPRVRTISDVVIDDPRILLFLLVAPCGGLGLGYTAKVAYNQQQGVAPLLGLFIWTTLFGFLSGFFWMRRDRDLSFGTIGFCGLCLVIMAVVASTQEAGWMIAAVYISTFVLAAIGRGTFQAR